MKALFLQYFAQDNLKNNDCAHGGDLIFLVALPLVKQLLFFVHQTTDMCIWSIMRSTVLLNVQIF